MASLIEFFKPKSYFNMYVTRDNNQFTVHPCVTLPQFHDIKENKSYVLPDEYQLFTNSKIANTNTYHTIISTFNNSSLYTSIIQTEHFSRISNIVVPKKSMPENTAIIETTIDNQDPFFTPIYIKHKCDIDINRELTKCKKLID